MPRRRRAVDARAEFLARFPLEPEPSTPERWDRARAELRAFFEEDSRPVEAGTLRGAWPTAPPSQRDVTEAREAMRAFLMGEPNGRAGVPVTLSLPMPRQRTILVEGKSLRATALVLTMLVYVRDEIPPIRRCAAKECPRRPLFVPADRRQRFCSDECRSMIVMRRKRGSRVLTPGTGALATHGEAPAVRSSRRRQSPTRRRPTPRKRRNR